MTRKPSILAALLAAAGAVACGALGSTGHPPEPPSAEEVSALLSAAAEAASRGDDAALRECVEGGASYPEPELARLKASQFWTFRPAGRPRRLGPDAFRIRLLPERQSEPQGAVSVRVRLELPVRRGGDGRLRILSHDESERLEKLPPPEPPEGGPVVALPFPEEGDVGWDAARHYATELQAGAEAGQVCLSLRFDPPLTGPGLRADLPLGEGQTVGFGDEVRTELSLDADADATTGFPMADLYRQLGGAGSAERIQEWRDFGSDARLSVHGKKFVQTDGSRGWGFRVELRKVAPQVVGPGSWSDPGEVFFEKTQADPEVEVAGEVLTLRLPAAAVPMRAGAAYRVMLEANGGSSLPLKAHMGTAAAGACATSSPSQKGG
jgi:hypothetical protein